MTMAQGFALYVFVGASYTIFCLHHLRTHGGHSFRGEPFSGEEFRFLWGTMSPHRRIGLYLVVTCLWPALFAIDAQETIRRFRVRRQLRAVARCAGADIDPRSFDWCRGADSERGSSTFTFTFDQTSCVEPPAGRAFDRDDVAAMPHAIASESLAAAPKESAC